MWLVSAAYSASRVPSVPFWRWEMRFQLALLTTLSRALVFALKATPTLVGFAS